VASLIRLTSPAAVTVTFLPEKVMTFLVLLSKAITFLVIVLQTTVTTSTLSTFPDYRLSRVLVNSAAKIIKLSVGCHPLDRFTQGGPPPL